MEIQIDFLNGKKKPKLVKNCDGSWSVTAEIDLTPGFWSVWVRSIVDGEYKDGKGITANPKGKLKHG